MDEHVLLLFLLQVLVLLVCAKVSGEWLQRRGIPALAGELLTGILLGPTILGRAWPGLHAALFPADPVQLHMLETVSWLGVLFLLLSTGFEVHTGTVWRQGKACLIIGTVGVVVPILIGAAVFWWFPPEYRGPNATRLTFTLFLATAAAISALPVMARVLHDLNILKSDFGLLAVSAFIVNDILGWMVFSVVLSLAGVGGVHSEDIGRVLFEAVLFGTVCLTVGSKAVGALALGLHRAGLPEPGTSLTLICVLGLLCGAVTQWIGLHAILGFFLAGIMAGNSPEIKENTRAIISQMIHAIFVPIFFASIGLRVDFLRGFDVLAVVAITSVAIGGKFIGAWIGSRLAGLSRPDTLSMGIAHVPGGAMEIILAILAFELGLLSETTFVAVVFAALSSSIAVAPLLAWAIRRRQKAVEMRGLLAPGHVAPELEARTRWEAIPELCALVSEPGGVLDQQHLEQAVRRREEIMGTGLEHNLAVPHARIPGLREPIVAFARSTAGIDWDTRDGLPAHFIFLLLTQAEDEGVQVRLLACIARALHDERVRERLLAAPTREALYTELSASIRCDGSVEVGAG